MLTPDSLIPLLQKAKDAGEDAKVMSVLSGGVDGREIDLDDLGLKKGYTLPAAARHASVYNDCMVQVRPTRPFRTELPH